MKKAVNFSIMRLLLYARPGSIRVLPIIATGKQCFLKNGANNSYWKVKESKSIHTSL